MTRKRFVKLLMADGYSRNEANTVAAKARICGMRYSTAYSMRRLRIPQIKLATANFDAFCEAVRNLADTALKVGVAISKAATAFAETYTKEMEVNHGR